jgi:hypothetical protein
MRRLSFIIAIFLSVQVAHAQSVENDLVGLGMQPALAEYISAILPAGSVLGNDTYLKARNQANSADISILKVDGTDDTVLNAETGDVIKLAIAGTAEATLTDDQLTLSGASFQIVPGATSLLFRNNADSSTNLSLDNSGNVIIQGNLSLNAGELSLTGTGKTLAIQEATGASACSGTATANGTTAVTVATTCAITGSRIFISATGDGSGLATNDQGACWVTNIQNGTSFDLDCPDANNNAAYNWIIFHEAA